MEHYPIWGSTCCSRWGEATTDYLDNKKLNKSLPGRQKNPDSSNMFHMFNNNTSTDLVFWNISAYKHVLVPSYVIQVI